jgi:hypothetical protein
LPASAERETFPQEASLTLAHRKGKQTPGRGKVVTVLLAHHPLLQSALHVYLAKIKDFFLREYTVASVLPKGMGTIWQARDFQMKRPWRKAGEILSARRREMMTRKFLVIGILN